LAALGLDIERLSRLAYPECTKKVRDKIACAQFIAALTDGFKCILQLERINLLTMVLERAMTIKAIQGNSFVKGNEERNDFRRKEKVDS